MKWIQSTGGPLILMARDLVPRWRGCDGDYERACEIEGWLGVLEVEGGQALVLNDDPMETAALATKDSLLMVRWCYAQSEDAVLRHLERANEVDFPVPDLTVDFGSRSVVLIDASASGSDLQGEKVLRLELPAAKCEVRTLDWEPDDATNLILHSLVPAE